MRFVFFFLLLVFVNPALAQARTMRLVCTLTETSLDIGPRRHARPEDILILITYSTNGSVDILSIDGLQGRTQLKGTMTDEAIDGKSDAGKSGEVISISINRITGVIVQHQYLPEMGTLNAFGTCKPADKTKF